MLIPCTIVCCIIISCAGTESVQSEDVLMSEGEQQDDFWTLLERGETEKAQEFFKGKMNVHAVDQKGRTALHRAAELGDYQLTAFMLSLNANLDVQDAMGRTALEIACIEQHADIADLLCQSGADIFLGSTLSSIPALLAINGPSTLLEAMLHERPLQASNSDGNTLLHLLAIKGDTISIAKVLEAGANPQAKNKDGKSALDIAYQRPNSLSHALSAEELVKKGTLSSNSSFSYFAPAVLGSNYNIRLQDGLTPLHLASREGHTGFVRLLFQRNIDINIKSASGTNALHEACRTGQLGVIRLLIQEGIDVQARDAKGNTALHIVMPLENRLQSIQLLLANGADPNIKDDHGDSPLHICIDLNLGIDVARVLLENGTDIGIRNTEGKSVLHSAIANERHEYINLLLEYGADIFAADTNGTSPLDMAIKQDSQALSLLINERTVLQSDNAGNTALHCAVRSRAKLDTISAILDAKAQIQARNKLGETALHLAVQLDEKEAGELLLSRGADIFAPNAAGRSPLYIAAHSPEGIRAWMLNSSSLEARDGLGNSIIHYAAQWGLDTIIPQVIAQGGSTEIKNATGETALFSAVKADKTNSIQALLDAGANLYARDTQGNTALHAAIRWNTENAARTLIQSGPIIHERNLQGKTALHEAVRLGMSSIESLLVQSGAKLELRDIEGNTPLMEAVHGGNSSSVERLCDYGANPEARNIRGNTPLHSAVLTGRTDIANLLLHRGASIHARNADGQTPFDLALISSEEMVGTLLTKDRLLTSDDDGNTALHIAIMKNAESVFVQRIISQGVAVSASDAKGYTPLHLAIQKERWDIVRSLVEAGSDIFARALNGDTPAELVLRKNEEAVRALFISQIIHAQDSLGNTALHYAAKESDVAVIDILLELGALKTVRNVAGENPADIARRWNRTAIAQKLDQEL